MKTPEEEILELLLFGYKSKDFVDDLLGGRGKVDEALKRLSQIMEEANRPGREIWVAHNTGTTLENDVENMSFYNSRHEAVKVWGDRQLITKASLKQGQDS